MLKPAFRLMRPGDWAKNVFVLIAPVFAMPGAVASAPEGEVAAAVGGIVVASLMAVAAFFVSACRINNGLVNSSLPAGAGLTLDESFNIGQGIFLFEFVQDYK